MNNSSEVKLYDSMYIIANLFLGFSVILCLAYLVAPLLGGKLSGSALAHYGTWIILALAMRAASQRGRKGLRFRAYEYTYLCLAGVVNVIVWFSYPVNIILAIMTVLGIVVSSRAHIKRINKEQKNN